MTPPRLHRRRRARGRRGQTTLESLMVMSLTFMIFAVLVYFCFLGIAKMVGYHATYVTARSHVVGFEHDIVYRAAEVGTIGMAGKPLSPDSIVGLDTYQLGTQEPALIRDFLQSDTYSMNYTYWGQTYANLPRSEVDGAVSVRVWVWDYAMGDEDNPMPLNLHELKTDVNRDHWMRMYNHAAFYLE
jgi:hypothetical protein